MNERTVQSVIHDLTTMVQSKKPIAPEQWVDAAMFLQTLKFQEQDKRLALEILANKKKKEIRATVGSNVDADLEWKTTEEYEAWRRQEDLMKEMVEFGRLAKKEADIRKLY